MKQPVNIHLVLLLGLILGGCASSGEGTNLKESREHYQMGANHFGVGEVPQAIMELTNSITLDPKNYKALHLMGFIYMGRKQYPEAVRYFKEALAVKPDYYICMNNLGVAYLFMERWEDAAKVYEELVHVSLYTSPWLAYANLGWAYYNMGRTTEGVEQTKMALFLNPEMCLAANNLGIMYSAQMDFEEAEGAFADAITQCPTYAEPHLHLGKLLAEAGRSPKAHHHFRQCVELSPKSSLGERCRQYARMIR